MEKGLVSIIMPAYNAGQYIKDAVDSALAQTYSNIEIVVVDDGSTDDTAAIMARYAAEKRINFIQQKNQGVAAARNTALAVAKGEFVAFLDADDLFLPNKIEKQIGYLQAHPECGVCYCDIFHFRANAPDKFLFLEQGMYSGDEVFERLLQRFFINPLSVVARRSAIDVAHGFNPQYRTAEDFDLFLRMAYAGVRFEHMPEKLAKYRMQSASLSYDPRAQIARKKNHLAVIVDQAARMSAQERERYRVGSIIFRHRLRLWYAELAQFLPFLTWAHQRIQKDRLVSA